VIQFPRQVRCMSGEKYYHYLSCTVSALPLKLFTIAYSICIIIEFTRMLYYNRSYKWYTSTFFHYRWSYPFDAIYLPKETCEYEFHFCSLILCGFVLLYNQLNCTSSIFNRLILFSLYGLFFSYDKSYYNNHYWLILLIAFELCIVHSSSSSSSSASSKRKIPRWHVMLFRYQISIVYFFGGIAKLNTDWMNGWPIRKWMTDAYKDAFNEVFLKDPNTNSNIPKNVMVYLDLLPEMLTYIVAWGGIVFDLCIPFVMSAQYTIKYYGFLTICLFHLINFQLFDIGIFPLLGLSTSVLYFNETELKRLFIDVIDCCCCCCCCCWKEE
jgi:vitamin K-dependent gamma-carboxylase